jgi:hypothetical protein
MRTRELVEKLRTRFGNVVFVWIYASRVRVVYHEGKGFIELEGVIEVDTGDKVLCGDSIVKARCDFINAVYGVPLGTAIYETLLHRPPIYIRYHYAQISFYLYVPCNIVGVNIDKFKQVTESGKECPYEGTDKCPLYRVRILGS